MKLVISKVRLGRKELSRKGKPDNWKAGGNIITRQWVAGVLFPWLLPLWSE